jgi:hypothetical protein
MQAIGIILMLVSIGTIVGPIGAVVVTYRDNLAQMVITPQVSEILNGNFPSAVQTNTTDNGGNDGNNGNGNGDNGGTNDNSSSGDGDDGFGSLVTPVFVGSQIDNVSRTFSVTVNFTNTFGLDLTINAVSADVQCSQHGYQLGTISLANPVTINSGETTPITVSGAWTQEAENHVLTEHAGATSVDANLVNLSVNVNGIVISQAGPISVGSVPIA